MEQHDRMYLGNLSLSFFHGSVLKREYPTPSFTFTLNISLHDSEWHERLFPSETKRSSTVFRPAQRSRSCARKQLKVANLFKRIPIGSLTVRFTQARQYWSYPSEVNPQWSQRQGWLICLNWASGLLFNFTTALPDARAASSVWQNSNKRLKERTSGRKGTPHCLMLTEERTHTHTSLPNAHQGNCRNGGMKKGGQPVWCQHCRLLH